MPDGREWVRLLDPRSAGGVSVLESADGVDVTAFLNITGQVIYSKIMEAYLQEAFVVSKLVDTIPTRLDGEKIPGISRVADTIDAVGPGMPYPTLGLRRGLHRNAFDDEARLHRAGDQRSDFLRPHAPCIEPRGRGRRGARPEQGEAADRPGDRRDQQLQVERHDLQHVSDQHAVDQFVVHERAGRLDERRQGRAACSPIFSIRTRASLCWCAARRCW